ncbi:MAG: hypothetical protein J7604_25905 [Sporocytophaga sp.]|uniref:VapE domain-containing protein n=1 Tax=Sporocytophaga sp. TaxID=2231183 RepID=UPI001B2B8134|nr:VapE domain-containing protein [Sporocytophaga sp.]MBO9703666.1 hypothetical protein [Sporocytophaga sp.]
MSKSLQKIITYLRKKYSFRYNEVTGNYEYKLLTSPAFKRLDDRAINSLVVEMNLADVLVTKKTLEILLGSNFCTLHNPLRSYFEGLPDWDGHDYIKDLCDTVPTSVSELWYKWFSKWLVALINCALNNIANGTIIVLVGDQGTRKTTWSKTLIPKELGEYTYSGSIDPTNKDTAITLSDCFLVILDELGNLNRGEIRDLKNIITEEIINHRAPYERSKKRMKRHASFIASVNDRQFLTDTTGNRRFLPIPVSLINADHAVDINKVYAQAYSLLKSGFRYWFDKQELDELNEHNSQFEIPTLEEELLLKKYIPADETTAIECLMTSEILVQLSQEFKLPINGSTQYQLGKALHKHKFTWRNKGKRRRWFVKPTPIIADDLYCITTANKDKSGDEKIDSETKLNYPMGNKNNFKVNSSFLDNDIKEVTSTVMNSLSEDYKKSNKTPDSSDSWLNNK